MYDGVRVFMCVLHMYHGMVLALLVWFISKEFTMVNWEMPQVFHITLQLQMFWVSCLLFCLENKLWIIFNYYIFRYKEYHQLKQNCSSEVTCPQLANFSDCCVHDPPLYYFYREVLNISPSVEDTGTGITWKLLGYLALTWVVTYLCVIKGIKSSGKVILSVFVSAMTGSDCKPCSFLKMSPFLRTFLINKKILRN